MLIIKNGLKYITFFIYSSRRLIITLRTCYNLFKKTSSISSQHRVQVVGPDYFGQCVEKLQLKIQKCTGLL